VLTGQTGIVVNIYIYIYIYCSDIANPLQVEKKYVLILHKSFEISCSNSFISAVLK